MPSNDDPHDSTRTFARIPTPEHALARLPLDPGDARSPAGIAAELAAFHGALQTVSAFALEPRLRLDGTGAIELYAVTPPALEPTPVIALREAILDVVESCAPSAPAGADGAGDARDSTPSDERVASFRANLDAAAPRLLELVDSYLVELYA